MTRLSIVIFVVAFALAAIATAPLAFALRLTDAGDMGFGAANVSGSVWNGQIDNASLGGDRLGDVRASLNPVSLVTGVSRLRLQSNNGAATLIEGRLHGFEAVTATVSLNQVGFALPMEGQLSFNDASLVFAGENCRTASGSVATDMFQRGFAGPALTGRLSCAGGQGVARLAGKSENVEIAMTVRIRADGQYRLDMLIIAVKPSLQAMLATAGFVQRGKGWERTEEGQLKF
jgi:hypothetical protein